MESEGSAYLDPSVEDNGDKYLQPDCKFEYRTERYKLDHGSLGDKLSQTEMRSEWLDEIAEAIQEHEDIIMRRNRKMLTKWMKWYTFLTFQLWKPESMSDMTPVYVASGLPYDRTSGDPVDNVIISPEDLTALQTVWDNQEAYREMWSGVRKTLNAVNEGAVHGLMVHSFHKWAETTAKSTSSRTFTGVEVQDRSRDFIYLQNEQALSLFSTLNLKDLCSYIAHEASKLVACECGVVVQTLTTRDLLLPYMDV